MLDYKLSASVSDLLWESAVDRASLPQSHEEFFAESGSAPIAEDSRRHFQRVRVRGRAIVRRGEQQLGVYPIDVSSEGIGFISPVQFLPKEKVELFCEQSQIIQLDIRRCFRTDEQCYSCGAIFLTGPMSPGAFRNFLSELRD